MSVRNGAGEAGAGIYTMDINGNTKATSITQNSIIWTSNSSTFVSTAAMSKGDTFASTGAGLSLIAVGTDGYALTCDSTQATGLKWASPTAQPLCFLGSATASASASLAFSANIFHQYKQLFFVIDNLLLSSTSAKLTFGIGAIPYYNTCSQITNSSGVSASGTGPNATTAIMTQTAVSATANQTINSTLIYTTSEIARPRHGFVWTGSYYDASSVFCAMNGSACVSLSGLTAGTFTFAPTTGTITSGTIYCYASALEV
jgi:hypothetical protein